MSKELEQLKFENETLRMQLEEQTKINGALNRHDEKLLKAFSILHKRLDVAVEELKYLSDGWSDRVMETALNYLAEIERIK